MRNKLAVSATLLFASLLPGTAHGSTFTFSFAGSGVSGTVVLTYGAATDAKYSQAFEVTGITGTFSDFNPGVNIVNASITGLEPLSLAAPESTNLLAPHDFSKFAVATRLPAMSNGAITFDNLFYPGGSPPTASDYTVHGGPFDIYGVLFDIGGGKVVNLFSNGDFTGTGKGPIDYGVVVATSATAIDYVAGGVSSVPEPATLWMLSAGLLGAALWMRRTARHQSL
jgi:hypothetical protein